ncbi:MarR family winged helix-turn-helix transcriptional regulator [Parafrankia sp. EUN1f]|uniref:MarR family winged helix-turn-helix transcriptional regulator n=1 Tax=Parafrankia sp. EUN1f TaxID=102897 RepID=UPI0001C45EDC|nr:MarR family winged helix-turn-helix transcriptional regulator [Parafrankia sp. EUN1f]EFC81885.1 transcriptional regulator, MarR family [Parafrankia sp. EUN1f]
MPPPDTGDPVIDLVLAVGHQVRRAVNEALRTGAGLTLARLKVLRLVADRGPVRPRDLAQAVAVAPRTMTETVDGLEADGLVCRRVDPTDRRAILLELTPLGRATLDRAQTHAAGAVEHFTGALSADERATLGRLLRLLLDNASAGNTRPLP